MQKFLLRKFFTFVDSNAERVSLRRGGSGRPDIEHVGLTAHFESSVVKQVTPVSASAANLFDLRRGLVDRIDALQPELSPITVFETRTSTHDSRTHARIAMKNHGAFNSFHFAGWFRNHLLETTPNDVAGSAELFQLNVANEPPVAPASSRVCRISSSDLISTTSPGCKARVPTGVLLRVPTNRGRPTIRSRIFR